MRKTVKSVVLESLLYSPKYAVLSCFAMTALIFIYSSLVRLNESTTSSSPIATSLITAYSAAFYFGLCYICSIGLLYPLVAPSRKTPDTVTNNRKLYLSSFVIYATFLIFQIVYFAISSVEEVQSIDLLFSHLKVVGSALVFIFAILSVLKASIIRRDRKIASKVL